MTRWEVKQNQVANNSLIDVVSIIRIDFEMQLDNLEKILVLLRLFYVSVYTNGGLY